MSPITFLHPERIHLLWAVLGVVAFVAWREVRSPSRLDRFIARPMQPRLVERATVLRRALRLGLFLASLVLGVLALMQPQSRIASETIESREAAGEVMVLLDVSRSMLAEDAAPDRLERAKAEIRDLVRLLAGHRVGLTAFAGRAVVLCPLTPDHGFFRLVLDGASPKSVSRGGTEIGGAIQKALLGFRPGPSAKMILLVTDGDDHDSYAVEAAKAAHAAGVRIVAIGFGDEKGAEIPIVDPKTGIRAPLRDKDGNVVRSKLDGALLREIALATEGAYVPAGTGVLDLESIVREYLTPFLARGGAESTRVVHEERYQGFVLASLVALVGAVVAGARAASRRRPAPLSAMASSRLSVVLAAFAFAAASGAHTAARAEDALAPTGSRTNPARERPVDLPPRKVYNAALAALAKQDLEAAEKGFSDARDRAGPDHDLRYRSAFDLAFTLAARAEGLEKEKPEDAVTALRTSAAWFRDAIREEPGDRDARANLEVVLRRLQALTDALEKKAGTLEAKLDRLIEDQRSLRDEARGLVEKIDAAGASAEPTSFQDAFRSQATWQRVLLTDTGDLATRAGEELGHLESKREAERKDEDRLRLGQLKGLAVYLDRARQRMADARRLLQKLQGDSAHRAADGALRELGRAKEQLLDPGKILQGLLADELHVLESTHALTASRKAALSVAEAKAKTAAPAWLTPVYLSERQDDARERTVELAQRFAAAVTGGDTAASSSAALAPGHLAPVVSERRMKRTLDAVREALPPIEDAARSMESAKVALTGEHLGDAESAETAAIEGLGRALERLSGIKALVELAYAEQQRIQALLSPPRSGEPTPGGRAAPSTDQTAESPLSTEERAKLVRAAVERNRERVGRLALLFEDELAEIDEKAKAKDAAKGDAKAGAAEKERYRLAERERSAAASALERLAVAIAGDETPLHEAAPPTPPLALAQEGLAHLEALRRLFFSIIEHLEELLREEARGRDETATGAAKKEPKEREAALAPLPDQEGRHAALARALAQELEKLGASTPPPGKGGQGQPDGPSPAVQASEETKLGAQAMEGARDHLKSQPPAIEGALTDQKEACEHLARAIALLKPPGESKDQQQQGQDQDEKQKKGEEQKEQVSREQAARRLQAVRDREAMREAQRRRGDKIPSDPTVEKDW